MNLIKGLRRYGQSIQHDPKLDRDFLVRLWVDERKMISSMEKRWSKSREKRRDKVVNYATHGETGYAKQSSFQNPFERWFSASSAAEERSYDQPKKVLKQPPVSQRTTGALKPSSVEEVTWVA